MARERLAAQRPRHDQAAERLYISREYRSIVVLLHSQTFHAEEPPESTRTRRPGLLSLSTTFIMPPAPTISGSTVPPETAPKDTSSDAQSVLSAKAAQVRLLSFFHLFPAQSSLHRPLYAIPLSMKKVSLRLECVSISSWSSEQGR